MSIKALFVMVFRNKKSGKDRRNKKRITNEHEQNLIQQKMDMLNGRNEQSH